jgi:hypothetical protein
MWEVTTGPVIRKKEANSGFSLDYSHKKKKTVLSNSHQIKQFSSI